jgi:23S rRNA pseudouridine2605 synthase
MCSRNEPATRWCRAAQASGANKFHIGQRWPFGERFLPPSREPQRPSAKRETQRIAKLLARAGIASRREVERMIAEGRVAIAGKIVETPATLLTSLHGVTVDGKPVRPPAPARLFRYHKPAGLLTAERDPKGRPTIYDRLPKGLPRLMPVGRLDMNTEGLLLLTTDGELKRQLELPATGVERAYRARTFGEISQERLEQLIEGIEIEGMRYGPIDANLERRTGRNQWIELKLREGKNREVRRVLEHLGLKVSRLIRTAYGPFALADLPAGAVDEIRQHDLVAFRKILPSISRGGGPPAQPVVEGLSETRQKPLHHGTSRRGPPPPQKRGRS